MEIDTNIKLQLPDDHSTAQELSKQEWVLYLSAIEELIDCAETIEKYQEQNDGVDPEAPKLERTRESLQTAIALSELLEEIAAWRRHGTSQAPRVNTYLSVQSSGKSILVSGTREMNETGRAANPPRSAQTRAQLQRSSEWVDNPYEPFRNP